MSLTKSQERAIRRFEYDRINSELLPRSNGFTSRIRTREIKETPYGAWLTIELEFGPEVGEHSLLRVLDGRRWHLLIGKRGRVEVHGCPKAEVQFAGRVAFGMHYLKNVVGY